MAHFKICFRRWTNFFAIVDVDVENITSLFLEKNFGRRVSRSAAFREGSILAICSTFRFSQIFRKAEIYKFDISSILFNH